MQTQNPFEQITARLDELSGKIDQIIGQEVKPTTPEKWITTGQAAEMLGVHRITLWHWRKKEILKPVRFGSVMRYRLRDIEALAAQQQQ